MLQNFEIFFSEYLALTPKSMGVNGGKDLSCFKKGVVLAFG